MFGRSHLWSHLVLDFCLLGVFILLIQFHYWWLIRSYFLFLPCAVFGDSMFLGIYFLLVVHYIGILWLIIISHISWYFCGISCNLTFFISDFIYVAHLFFFFLLYLAKGCKFSFRRTNSFFHWSFLFFSVSISFISVVIFMISTNLCCSVAQSCPTLCSPMDGSMPGFPVLHNLLEFAQTSNFSFCFLLFF